MLSYLEIPRNTPKPFWGEVGSSQNLFGRGVELPRNTPKYPETFPKLVFPGFHSKSCLHQVYFETFRIHQNPPEEKRVAALSGRNTHVSSYTHVCSYTQVSYYTHVCPPMCAYTHVTSQHNVVTPKPFWRECGLAPKRPETF